MAEFMVKTNAVKSAADTEERLRRELDHIQRTVRGISGSLVIRTAGAAGIKRRLSSLAGRVDGQRGSMEKMKNALERAAALYEAAERNICGYAEGSSSSPREKKESSFWGDFKDWIQKAVGAAGAVVGGILSALTAIWGKTIFQDLGKILEILGKGHPTPKPPTAGWGEILKWLPKFPEGFPGWFPKGFPRLFPDGFTQGASQGASEGATSGTATPGGAPKYKQPEYTQKNLAPDANGIYGPVVYWRDGRYGTVCEWNTKEGVDLSCTYYTLRKLNEQGLSYPCKGGPGNGGQWYANFDEQSNLPSYAGDNALDQLANSPLPQANVVVSFEGGTLNNGKKVGHVLLIDEIYKDGNGTVRVKYSDMFYEKPGGGTQYINSLNDNNPQLDIPLAEFKTNYHNSNGNINGAVVIGAGERPRKLT